MLHLPRPRASREDDSGSLLLDVLIGMAIVALLALIAISVFRGYREKVAVVSMKSDLSNAANALTGQGVFTIAEYGSDLSRVPTSPHVTLRMNDAPDPFGNDRAKFVWEAIINSSTDCGGITNGQANIFIYITEFTTSRYYSDIRPCVVAHPTGRTLAEVDATILWLEAAKQPGRVFIPHLSASGTTEPGYGDILSLKASFITVLGDTPGLVGNPKITQVEIQDVYDHYRAVTAVTPIPCVNATHATYTDQKWHYRLGEGLAEGTC